MVKCKLDKKTSWIQTDIIEPQNHALHPSRETGRFGYGKSLVATG
jgi:hypothetical protein